MSPQAWDQCIVFMERSVSYSQRFAIFALIILINISPMCYFFSNVVCFPLFVCLFCLFVSFFVCLFCLLVYLFVCLTLCFFVSLFNYKAMSGLAWNFYGMSWTLISAKVLQSLINCLVSHGVLIKLGTVYFVWQNYTHWVPISYFWYSQTITCYGS